jgi:hypothetical protein
MVKSLAAFRLAHPIRPIKAEAVHTGTESNFSDFPTNQALALHRVR